MKFSCSLKRKLVIAFFLLCDIPAFAHHSVALFDMSKVIRIEGTVHRLDWKNPHIYLIVETLNENGEAKLIQVEGLAITQARVEGLDREALLPGARVIVRANPNLRGAGLTVRGLNVATMDGKVHPFYERSSEPRALRPAEGLSGKWAPSFSETGRVFGVVSRNWKFKEEGVSENSKGVCEIEPVPFLTMINELRVIEVNKDNVIMRHDNSGDIGVRTVHLDQTQHPEDLQLTLFGHSIGHWEGEPSSGEKPSAGKELSAGEKPSADKVTLVIDTVGYAPNYAGLFDRVRSGVHKHTIERLTLTQDRRQIRYEFTVEDPDYLESPASFSMLWDHRPDLNLSTEPCDPAIADRYLRD